MALRPLSTLFLLELLDLFEQSSQPIGDAEGQRLHGVPGWHMVDRTSLTADEISAWTERVGYVGSYPADFGDECVPVDLQEDDAPDRYWYRCPETFRKRYVSAANAAVYAVSPSKFLHQISDLMQIAQPLRRGIDTPAIEGTLWKLGEARIGPSLTPVWLARGLAGNVDLILNYFMSATLPEQGMVLTSGHALPSMIRVPRNYRVASLRDVIVDYSAKPCIDITLMERILTAPADGVLPRVQVVQYDEQKKVLTIRTKPEPWTIKGKHQAAAVLYLYQQAQKDRWEVDASEILAAAYPEKKSDESRRGLKMQDLFKGNTKWLHYLRNTEKGKYAFNLG